MSHFNNHSITLLNALCTQHDFRLMQVFPGSTAGKESACSAEDLGLISEFGRSSGEGNGNPLQYSCLGNPMDRGAWRATVHGVAKESDTTQWLNNSNKQQCEVGTFRIPTLYESK